MFAEFHKACAELVPHHEKYLEEPRQGNADLALPCFILAKEQKRNPVELAQEIARNITIPEDSLVLKVESAGPYVNFFINFDVFTPLVLKAAGQKNYGHGAHRLETILIESPGPNTNKPLHLGHVRNMALGMAVANMLRFTGAKVVNVDIVNDRGVHICKSMLAYQKLGNNQQPTKKTDHFVGDYYVRFAQELEGKPGIEDELHAMLVAWERGDPAVRALWEKMNSWALAGMAQTYQRFGMHIEKAYYESEHYEEGKDIVQTGLQKGLFHKDADGNIIANLEFQGLGKRVLLRKDGTTVYITQDIALAARRYHDYRMDSMIHVVGAEQIDHFKVLFTILKLLDYPFADRCYHLAYGMVNLPEGKMKSREGTVVDADNLLDQLHIMAAQEIEKREPHIDREELRNRAEKIALAAVKLYILKFDAQKFITYDPKVSLSFEGDTGPYLLYTYARALSVLRKSQFAPRTTQLGTEESAVVKKLSQFPGHAQHAAREYKPHILAVYALELAATFNEYYHATKIIGSDREPARLAVVQAIANVLHRSLALLGIETLEKM